jgi:2',3'-cyclic-nucleotide 2'-phosphodiesterase
MNAIKILCIGDIVGPAGRAIVQKVVPNLKRDYAIDCTIINGENSAHDGRGITERIVRELKHNGADVITTGNHVWAKKEIYAYFDKNTDLLRPANFPTGVPGMGMTFVTTQKGATVAVINLQGRVFMREMLNCPFRTADSLITYARSKASTIIIDFHAETTAEKQALAFYLDGKVSALVGTHTHVQTADERVLPEGTAFITDLGMTGSLNSMIGMKKEPVLKNFLLQMPTQFQVETASPLILCGVVITVDTDTGKALDIHRVRVIDTELNVQAEQASERSS